MRVGDTATFTLTVTNTGDVPLSNVVVTDAKCDGPPVFQSGDTNAKLETRSDRDVDYTCSTAERLDELPEPGDVKGTPPVGPDVTDQDTAEVVVIHPAIQIVKTPDTQTVPLGGTATFTLTVTNTGDVPLTNVVVTDAQCTSGVTYVSGDTGTTGSSACRETWKYSCSIANVQDDFTNTAHVTGNPPVGPNVTSERLGRRPRPEGQDHRDQGLRGGAAGAKVTIRIKQGATVKASGDVADNGSINGTFAPDTFTVDETSAAGDVDLALYDQSVSCLNGQTPVASNPTGSSVSFALVDGADVTCTITNSLRPVLTVKKVVVGDTESTFDLFVKDGQQFNTKVIDDGGNGATDTRTYSPGAYTVSETTSDGSTPVDTTVWDVSTGTIARTWVPSRSPTAR